MKRLTYYPGRLEAAQPVGGATDAVTGAVKVYSGGGDLSTTLAAAGTVFGPIGTVVGGIVGSLFGGSGPCKESNQNPQLGAPAITAAQADWWVQAAGKQSLIKTYQKCVSAWNNISWPEFISWHYEFYRQKHKYKVSPQDAPAALKAQVRQQQPQAPQAAIYQQQPVAYQQPIPGTYAVSYGQALTYQDPAAEQQRRQREEYRRVIDQRLAEFQAARSTAQVNYQIAYQSGNAALAGSWAGYYAQVDAGVRQLEAQRLQYL